MTFSPVSRIHWAAPPFPGKPIDRNDSRPMPVWWHHLTFMLLLFGSLFISGCKEVTTSDIEIRKGVAYLKDSFTPYSGPVKGYYQNSDGTNGKLMVEGTYVQGLKFDVWTTFGWNGEKSTVKYENGLEEGAAEQYDSNGKLLRSISYSKGKRHGYSNEYDESGKPVRQVFYRHGTIHGPPNPKKGEGKEEETVELNARELEEKLYGKRQKSMMEYIMEFF
ncbi:MAG: hypothetical protein HQL76_12675 [Magnetococcales bacterium]|nr:hypothetical protein [Magnetococcales bacterium]